MNIRLIDVVSDLIYFESTTELTTEVLVLSYGSSISLKSDIETIFYKRSPLSVPVLGGNAGCMCTYYVNPKVITENIAKEVTDLGLTISQDSDLAIEISNKSDSFLTSLSIDIKKNGISIASKEFRIRNRYHGDLDLNTGSRSGEGSMIHHITKNTFWNSILELTGRIKQQDKLVSSFINRNIRVKSSKKEEVLLAAKLAEIPPLNSRYQIDLGRSGDFVECESKMVSRNYQISSGLHILDDNLVIPIEHSLKNIEKIVCLGRSIYIVTTPKYYKEFFLISEFDYKGKNIANTKYSIPSRKWKGHPRKPLIYFQAELEQIIIGIREYGDNIDSENIYYILPKQMPNKSSKRDAVTAAPS